MVTQQLSFFENFCCIAPFYFKKGPVLLTNFQDYSTFYYNYLFYMKSRVVDKYIELWNFLLGISSSTLSWCCLQTLIFSKVCKLFNSTYYRVQWNYLVSRFFRQYSIHTYWTNNKYLAIFSGRNLAKISADSTWL